MWKRRKLATPGFGHVPFNPIQGDQANLRQDGTSPFCAMFQVAAADTYADYVICRGFDPRILRFIDYAAGDSNKPGVSVAKPFGKRVIGTYEIGEVYPALLPTQGNTEYSGFRQVTFVPPSPVAVNWRVGQNPGVVTGGLEGGQPDSLSDQIGILYDHNGKVVNWLLLDSASRGSEWIEYVITSMDTKVTGPYTGLNVATVIVKGGSEIAGTGLDVVDHSGGLFDVPGEMAGYTGWAMPSSQYLSLEAGVECDTKSPRHWAAINRVCAADTGIYATECAEFYAPAGYMPLGYVPFTI